MARLLRSTNLATTIDSVALGSGVTGFPAASKNFEFISEGTPSASDTVIKYTLSDAYRQFRIFVEGVRPEDDTQQMTLIFYSDAALTTDAAISGGKNVQSWLSGPIFAGASSNPSTETLDHFQDHTLAIGWEGASYAAATGAQGWIDIQSFNIEINTPGTGTLGANSCIYTGFITIPKSNVYYYTYRFNGWGTHTDKVLGVGIYPHDGGVYRALGRTTLYGLKV